MAQSAAAYTNTFTRDGIEDNPASAYIGDSTHLVFTSDDPALNGLGYVFLSNTGFNTQSVCLPTAEFTGVWSDYTAQLGEQYLGVEVFPDALCQTTNTDYWASGSTFTILDNPSPPAGMLPLPVDFISASLASTSQLVADFEVPLAFIIGAIVLFLIVPKIISWFKQISDRGRYTSK